MSARLGFFNALPLRYMSAGALAVQRHSSGGGRMSARLGFSNALPLRYMSADARWQSSGIRPAKDL